MVEDTETFFLFLSFDKSTPQRIRDVVTIKPAGTVVTIIDATLCKLLGFVQITLYTVMTFVVSLD